MLEKLESAPGRFPVEQSKTPAQCSLAGILEILAASWDQWAINNKDETPGLPAQRRKNNNNKP
ncbi:MAG: hypothetical protein ACYC46_06610 [Acidobacteriaceae bacterium]